MHDLAITIPEKMNYNLATQIKRLCNGQNSPVTPFNENNREIIIHFKTESEKNDFKIILNNRFPNLV